MQHKLHGNKIVGVQLSNGQWVAKCPVRNCGHQSFQYNRKEHAEIEIASHALLMHTSGVELTSDVELMVMWVEGYHA